MRSSASRFVASSPERRARPPARRWTGVLINTCVVATTAASIPFLENPAATLFLGGCSVLLTFPILAFMEGRRSPLWLTPVSMYFGWYSIGLGFSALYIASLISSGRGIRFSVVTVSPEEVANGYVIYLVGLLALHVGIECFRPMHVGEKAARWVDLGVGRLGRLSFLWALGLSASFRPDWFAPIGLIAGLLRWGAWAAVCVLALTPRSRLGLSPWLYRLALTVGMMGLVSVGLLSESKFYIMWAFLPLGWRIMLRGRQTLLILAAVSAAVFYFSVVAPSVAASRRVAEERSLAELVLSGDLARNAHFSKKFLEQQGELFLVRQFDALPVGFFAGEVERSGLQRGATMRYAAYAFIPRAVWPDKPTVTRGGWFAAYLGFARRAEDSTVSLGMTATGELYWNFGVLGVCLGMFVFGSMIGGLWRLAGVDPSHRPLHMFLYLVLLFRIVNRSEAVSVLVSLVALYLLFRAAAFVLGRPRFAHDSSQKRRGLAELRTGR